MSSDSVVTCIADFEEDRGKYNDDQRFDVLVMVTSELWSSDSKTSIWIEDPDDAHGMSIMCAFKKDAREMMEEVNFVMNGQYMIRNALIHFNNTRNVSAYLAFYLTFHHAFWSAQSSYFCIL